MSFFYYKLLSLNNDLILIFFEEKNYQVQKPLMLLYTMTWLNYGGLCGRVVFLYFILKDKWAGQSMFSID